MKKDIKEKDRLEMIIEFYEAPDEALFNQKTLCAVLGCASQFVERHRRVGIGVPYIKIGSMVRYKKADILNYIESQKKAQKSIIEEGKYE